MRNPRMRGWACRLWPLALCLLPACQQQMALQPGIHRPDRQNNFFTDGQGNRPLVRGTIARGHLRTDRAMYAGLRPGVSAEMAFPAMLVHSGAGQVLPTLTAAVATRHLEDILDTDTFPFPVTEAVLRHGKNRYMIYCVVCHDPMGTGHGMIVERGYTRPPSYHVERLRNAPVGHFFRVATLGYGSMPAYGKQVPPRDRWAIAAYIRALQLSQRFPRKEMSEEMSREWKKQMQAAKAGGK